MSKFRFVIVSKDDKCNLSSNDFTISKYSNDIEVEFILNNTTNIPIVYNKQIEKAILQKNDFLILLHGDAYLNIDSLLQHIEECSHKYDIMGLCGTKILNVSQTPLNWWTGSNPTPDAKYGYVKHGELGNAESFFNKQFQYITDTNVACIDGVCIIFNKTALQSGIKFDTNFKFDQYDTDLSLQALLNYKLKLGVLIEKSLIHYSVGRGILEEKFLDGELLLREKWKLGFPENSRIKAIHNKKLSS